MQRECFRTLMILAKTTVLTDFGVCLLVGLVRVILFGGQKSYCGGILDHCTRLQCCNRVLAGQLLPHCLLVACFLACILRCMLEGFMGLGMVLQRRVGMWSHWMGWAYHACDQSCISSLLIIEVNKQNRHLAYKSCALIYRSVAQVAFHPTVFSSYPHTTLQCTKIEPVPNALPPLPSTTQPSSQDRNLLPNRSTIPRFS